MVELTMRFPEFRTKSLTLSYDDGTVFDREMVSILNRHALKCTFNLNSGLLGQDGKVTLSEVPKLYDGHEIAVHTVTHPHLENLAPGTAVREIIADREALEQITGKIVSGMAYPFGLSDERIIPLVEACGINYARTVYQTLSFDLPHNFLTWHPTCHHDYENIDALIGEFLEEDDLTKPWSVTPKLFYIWGHSYEFENRFDRLAALCKKIANHPDVWYATNGEIFDYVTAYNRLVHSADGTIIYNPNTIDLYASVNEKNIFLPSGCTVRIEI